MVNAEQMVWLKGFLVGALTTGYVIGTVLFFRWRRARGG